MQRLWLNASKLLLIALAILVTSCQVPDPPNITISQIDLPDNQAIGFKINTGEGPTLTPISEMDKWSCMDPTDKALLDNYIKALRRSAAQCDSDSK